MKTKYKLKGKMADQTFTQGLRPPVLDRAMAESTAGLAPSPALHRLPDGQSARSLRRRAVRQMQARGGNALVQRALAAPVQRQEEQAPSSPAPGPTESAAPSETGAPTELSAAGSLVRVGAGGVEIQGGMVNVDAAMTRVSGVLNTDTLVAQSVVSSSYTPGAGNIW